MSSPRFIKQEVAMKQKVTRWVWNGSMEEDVQRWDKKLEPWIAGFIGLAVGYFLGVAIFG